MRIKDYNSYEISDELYDNLNKVSETLFIPFNMQLNGLSIKEISVLLKINENTIKTRINRCKNFLKNGI
jgi:DNA-directed RNA polymerase specialized sigma24 family protein